MGPNMDHRRINARTWIGYAMILSAPSLAFAQTEGNARCTQAGMVRTVEVVRETAAPVPCSVNYRKETEAPNAPAEQLWNAENEVGYCEARAAEFVARLESLGWQCDGPLAARSEED